MKKFTLIPFLLITLSAMASKQDSLSYKNEFSLSMTNAMSQTFFNGPGNKPTAVVDYQNDGSFEYYLHTHMTYLPLYAVHLQLHYSAAITPLIRIETGLGYLMTGTLLKSNYQFYGDFSSEHVTQNTYSYTGSITLPLLIKYTKPMRHGDFTCAVGPEFNLPVHFFNHQTSIVDNNVMKPNIYTHTRYKTNTTGQLSTMGMYLKLGYQKHISQSMSINVGPVVDFFNLLQFHNTSINWPDYHAYQYYVGLDVAVNFGFKIITKRAIF